MRGSLNLYHHVQVRVASLCDKTRHHLPSRQAVSLYQREVVSKPHRGEEIYILILLPLRTPASTLSPGPPMSDPCKNDVAFT